MKNKLLATVLIGFIGSVGIAQNSVELVANQNPNYQISLDKYVTANTFNNATLLQGTTLQETYIAIDPMERKRENKELRAYFRSQRPLWRHQERLERAKNTAYYNYDNYRNYNTDYNYQNNRWLNSNTLLELGLFSYLIFD
ncbi:MULTISPECIES: hypothetical protein [unclassified Algibacter]|uniref:hypothetical protein n=1 Tax=unclassified Algibacter TaxID=2615009 RepID=UPI00131B77DE|nr:MULTISPECIES: hypothetical protein [unclassified Algibacter]MCL5127734.1 hypothetical protein [Algibacter sp. L4_22]